MGDRQRLVQAAARNDGVTEIVEIPGRGHSLTIDSGWREVADTALAFVQRFAQADEPERNAAKHEHAGMASDRA